MNEKGTSTCRLQKLSNRPKMRIPSASPSPLTEPINPALQTLQRISSLFKAFQRISKQKSALKSYEHSNSNVQHRSGSSAYHQYRPGAYSSAKAHRSNRPAW